MNRDVRYLLFSDSPAATNTEPLSGANHFHEQQNQALIGTHRGSTDWGSHHGIQTIPILSCGWGTAADISPLQMETCERQVGGPGALPTFPCWQASSPTSLNISVRRVAHWGSVSAFSWRASSARLPEGHSLVWGHRGEHGSAQDASEALPAPWGAEASCLFTPVQAAPP